MATGYFITGTDTGVGKTRVACALMAALQAQGLKVAGMKPVASGCTETREGLRNEDALMLSRQGNVTLPYELVNPYAFAPPIAPHLAAQAQGAQIDLQYLRACYENIARHADTVVVEGAGGWRVPLDTQHDMGDLARSLDLRVILVVGLRLGCINHALLSADAIRARGAELCGWVANTIDPHMLALDENIETLTDALQAPRLGVLGHAPSEKASTTARSLDITRLRAL